MSGIIILIQSRLRGHNIAPVAQKSHIFAISPTNDARPTKQRKRERIGETFKLSRSDRTGGGSGGGGGNPLRDIRLAKIFGEPVHAQPMQQSAPEKAYTVHDILLNSAGRISYGTWRGLIMYLTQAQQHNEYFTNAFFLTFRSFATECDLAEALIERAREAPATKMSPQEMRLWQERVQNPIRYRVFLAIKLWYERYWWSCMDSAILPFLCGYLANDICPHGMAEPPSVAGASMLADQKAEPDERESVHNRLSGRTYTDERSLTSSNEELVNIPQHRSERPAVRWRTIFRQVPHLDLLMATIGMDLSIEAYRRISHIMHVSPMDVACQLTIIESSCFCQIQPFELLNKEFSHGALSKAVNVRQMTKWCTQITRWASLTILSEPTPERRCRVLKYFIQLGIHLLALKNYDAVMAIKAAIYCAAVMRLKKTWALLPSKFGIMGRRLHEAMDPDRNYANYREMLRKSQPPLLPFLGLYLTDLTFLDDGNPTYRRYELPTIDDDNRSSSNCSSSINSTSPGNNKSNGDGDGAPKAQVQLTGQTCALFATRRDVDLHSPSILINFEKCYKLSSIIQELQKFQIEYSGNFTMAIPGLQQYLIEEWDKCEGYDDDRIYDLSLQREPRAVGGCINRGYQSVPGAAMRLTRLLPGTQRSRGREPSSINESQIDIALAKSENDNNEKDKRNDNGEKENHDDKVNSSMVMDNANNSDSSDLHDK
ncbi:ras guanine nucleotide exchange factor domain-containing protein [Kickxella alabastrina]|uniref:ras guanine nucleotide exchange factor domain-containing protein n=1 Tax=Kickxella alabastrina TaxID=61397 RepID=UPI00221F0F1C|nr:ras guanine nucleotide exchange factor domain-containing protein [Kickxella alabastrina]KAI7826270.1 ras guanine nucleotide exchange factor domain-containing protein [Kickxella alabastrina]